MPFVALAVAEPLWQSTVSKEGLNKIVMFYVYIIQSINFPKQFYTGFSENIECRLEEHNQGKSVHTNKYKPWEMIYYSVFDDKKRALDFEKYLKTASGIAFRNKRLILVTKV